MSLDFQPAKRYTYIGYLAYFVLFHYGSSGVTPRVLGDLVQFVFKLLWGDSEGTWYTSFGFFFCLFGETPRYFVFRVFGIFWYTSF